MTPDRIFRYVLHHEVSVYEALGWRVVSTLQGTRHGDWSQLMEYRGPEREHPLGPSDPEDDYADRAEWKARR